MNYLTYVEECIEIGSVELIGVSKATNFTGMFICLWRFFWVGISSTDTLYKYSFAAISMNQHERMASHFDIHCIGALQD